MDLMKAVMYNSVSFLFGRHSTSSNQNKPQKALRNGEIIKVCVVLKALIFKTKTEKYMGRPHQTSRNAKDAKKKVLGTPSYSSNHSATWYILAGLSPFVKFHLFYLISVSKTFVLSLGTKHALFT